MAVSCLPVESLNALDSAGLAALHRVAYGRAKKAESVTSTAEVHYSIMAMH
jgi:hypothetical protein